MRAQLGGWGIFKSHQTNMCVDFNIDPSAVSVQPTHYFVLIDASIFCRISLDVLRPGTH